MQELTYVHKIKLKERMEKNINKKDDWLHIIDLLKKYNPDIYITKNNNGCFVDIANLAPETYTEINNFLNNLIKKQEKLTDDNLYETDEIDTSCINSKTISLDNIVGCNNIKHSVEIAKPIPESFLFVSKKDNKTMLEHDNKSEIKFSKELIVDQDDIRENVKKIFKKHKKS